jgi:hypothetical protein
MPIFNDSRDRALQAEARNRAHAQQRLQVGYFRSGEPAALGRHAGDRDEEVRKLRELLAECRRLLGEAYYDGAEDALEAASLRAKIDAALTPR